MPNLFVNYIIPEVKMKEKILPYIDGLHVLPWLTDGAIDFLDGHIFG
jgi:hypothetical protein